jgi:hypothetical protein
MTPMALRDSRARVLLTVFSCALALAAALPAQEPTHVAYACTDADRDAFGLTCTMDDPCPVFLELDSADAAGGRLIVVGNLHTKSVTLYGIVLASDDNGTTWTEPNPRIPASALEQVEFHDLQNGWITGESVDPLARNPFLLITTDGGRMWHQKPIVEDTTYGTVTQFHFDSPTHGELVLDTPQPKQVHEELYETNTGGEDWELKQVNNSAIKLKSAHVPGQGPLRVRADASSGTFVVERGGGRTWNRVASFTVHIADCE